MDNTANNQQQQILDKLNALIVQESQESNLEMFRRLSADPSIHISWTDEFLESLPPRSEAESLALQQIQF